MRLESLANELLLDLFDYLNTKHLFHAFYHLNHRFKELIFIHYQLRGHLDFQSISQTTFHVICQEYLPHHLTSTRSIHLSDDDETSEQIHLFFHHYFQLSDFKYLKCLSLNDLSSEPMMTQIVIDLPELVHLSQLKISQCRVDHNSINKGWVFERIWNLKNLTYFYFQREENLWKPFFVSPKAVSYSIRSLYLEGFLYTASQLHCLLNHTINLINLKIDVDHNYDDKETSPKFYPIQMLEILVQSSRFVTSYLLRKIPDLTDLTIEMSLVLIDGDQWKEIIENHLPHLNTFRMTMEFSLHARQNRDEQVRRLLNTFRGSFWIDQHRWYVQCHWYASDRSSRAYMYTLPYHSKRLTLVSDLQFQSTCPNDRIHWSFDNVKKVLVKNRTCPLIRFDHLEHLKMTFPLDECFYSSVWNVHQLKSLDVMISKDVDSSVQLQNLVEKATSLYSLTLTGELSTKEIIYDLRSSSIRRVDLHDIGSFDEEEGEKLMNCCVGVACEVLMITVKDRHGIVALINGMKDLRALNVRSQDDKRKRNDDERLDDDELIRWLHESLPTLCVIKREYIHGISYVQTWVH